jgi:hypothetical protein
MQMLLFKEDGVEIWLRTHALWVECLGSSPPATLHSLVILDKPRPFLNSSSCVEARVAMKFQREMLHYPLHAEDAQCMLAIITRVPLPAQGDR